MKIFTPAARVDRGQRKVIFLGLRGIPEVQGGVETHVAALATGIAQRGWQVEVLGRRPYLASPEPYVWNDVTVTPLWSPRSKGFEALLHTIVGLVVAARRKPDLVHIHAIGPALLTPLACLLGLRVVVTHHGFDYQRQKWGRLARSVLRAGERIGMTFSHANIGVSKAIVESVGSNFGVAATFIPNGVDSPPPKQGTSYLDSIAVAPNRYILCVSRIVEEKRQLDLIHAYARLKDPDVKLLIVGKADHGGSYLRAVEQAAAATPGVVMTGFQSGEPLAQLFAHAGLFVLPSSHEGMPIALLEALSHGVPCLASDIGPNLALDLAADDYFPLGETDALADAMKRKLAAPDRARCRERALQIRDSFGWSPIVDRTLEVYESALPPAIWRPQRARHGAAGVSKHPEFGGGQ
jgi:glycosyltransferase involved in cell wall biosynthesis